MSKASEALREIAEEAGKAVTELANQSAHPAICVHSSMILDALATILERLDEIEAAEGWADYLPRRTPTRLGTVGR